jgi:hypothetical protein
MNMCAELSKIRKIILIGILMAACLVLFSCQSEKKTPEIQPTATAPYPDWERRWLKGIPCLAPCYEGVTPGKTTPMEALDILRNNPLFMDVDLSLLGGILWKWFNGENGGVMTFSGSASTGVINWIGPYIFDVYTLEEVIAIYGEPDEVFAWADTRNPEEGVYYEVVVIYIQKGFIIRQNTAVFGPKPNITQDMEFTFIEFFKPIEEIFFDKINPYYLGKTTPWAGFQDFDYYCKDGYEGFMCEATPHP